MNDEIKKLLAEGEELLGVTTAPVNFCLIKRQHTYTPYVIRGYCPRRNEFYKENEFCATDEQSAMKFLQTIVTTIVMHSV